MLTWKSIPILIGCSAIGLAAYGLYNRNTFFQKQEGYIVLNVVDGDTIRISAPFLPQPLNKTLLLRIEGVDTPEKGARAQCTSEDLKARQATLFTQRKLATAKTYRVHLHKWDKYGGRVLGSIYFDGISLKDDLIKNGLAREYRGEKKQSWCN